MMKVSADRGVLPAAPPLPDRGKGKEQPERDNYSCEGCPYRREEGCIGVCMRLILAEWKTARRASARDTLQ